MFLIFDEKELRLHNVIAMRNHAHEKDLHKKSDERNDVI